MIWAAGIAAVILLCTGFIIAVACVVLSPRELDELAELEEMIGQVESPRLRHTLRQMLDEAMSLEDMRELHANVKIILAKQPATMPQTQGVHNVGRR